MQLFLMIAAALLISAYSAPTTELPLNSTEKQLITESEYSAPTTELPLNSTEKQLSTESEDYSDYDDFWLLANLENVTQIELPTEDKKILCDFLGTFQVLKMQIFGAIFAANMELMQNVENKFKIEFKEYQDKHPHHDNKTQLEGFLGVGVDPLDIYDKETEFKKKFYQDIRKIYEKINEHFIEESQKIKSNLSRETVEGEKNFFEKFEAFKLPPKKKNYNDKVGLMNVIEKEFKHRYQCPGEEI